MSAVAATAPAVRAHGAHRRAFGLLFAGLVCIGMGQSMLFSILPPVARDLGISPFQVSTIFATSASIWVFVSPWWGRRSDVWGRRPIILVGLVGYALSMALLASTILVGQAHLLPAAIIYPLMIASRCVFALIGSGTGPASQAYVADRTRIAERAAAVAFLSAGMGLGETVGPGVGAALASVGLTAPIYVAAVLAVVSAGVIWWRLPEDGPPHASAAAPPRLRVRDPRVAPFLLIGGALQAVRATTTITLALFLQDTLRLDPTETVRRTGVGFMTVAIAGLFAQLVLVQRLQPTSRTMMRIGAPLMLFAFTGLTLGTGFGVDLVALAALGLGMGLVRPGTGAGASVSVDPEEQGGVAGLLGGVTVIGNVFGPMLGTSLYRLGPAAPYVLNATMMVAVVGFVLRSRRLRALRA